MFRIALLFALTGCASASFDVADAARDSGAAATDVGAVVDTGSTGQEDSTTAPETAPPTDGGCVDPPVAARPCVAATADYGMSMNHPGSFPVHKVMKGGQTLIHFKMPRNGRLGKVTLAMKGELVNGAGAAGKVYLAAFARGCKPRYLGLSSAPVSALPDAYDFHFDGTTTTLDTLYRGADVDLVLTTDSTMFKLSVAGNNPPTPNPFEMYWGTRPDETSMWSIATGSMLGMAVYTYACPG